MNEFTLFDGKVCRTCGKWRAFRDFHPRADRRDRKTARRVSSELIIADGYRSVCKSCRNTEQLDYYKTHFVPNPNPKKTGRPQTVVRTEEERLARQRDYYHSSKEQITVNRKAYEDRNKGAIKIRNAQKYQEHKDDIRAKHKVYRDCHKDQSREYRRRWYRENPESVKAKTHRRRALLLNATGSFSKEDWQEICELYDHKCLRCGEAKPLTVDHVLPLKKGGSNGKENLQPLCLSCNSWKSDKHIDYRGNYDGKATNIPTQTAEIPEFQVPRPSNLPTR